MTITTLRKTTADLGDVYWVDLDPVSGTEQAGRRPAVVLSETRLHDVSLRSMICPITSNEALWPTKVVIPPGCVVQGAVLLDQARMVDRKARLHRYIRRLPDDVVALAVEVLSAYIGRPDSEQTS